MPAKKYYKDPEIAVLKEKINNMNEKMDDIHKALMGNHKTGLIQEFSELRGTVKFVKYFLTGATPAVTAAMGFLFNKVL